jgi:hypothetical protein
MPKLVGLFILDFILSGEASGYVVTKPFKKILFLRM